MHKGKAHKLPKFLAKKKGSGSPRGAMPMDEGDKPKRRGSVKLGRMPMPPASFSDGGDSGY